MHSNGISILFPLLHSRFKIFCIICNLKMPSKCKYHRKMKKYEKEKYTQKLKCKLLLDNYNGQLAIWWVQAQGPRSNKTKTKRKKTATASTSSSSWKCNEWIRKGAHWNKWSAEGTVIWIEHGNNVTTVMEIQNLFRWFL